MQTRQKILIVDDKPENLYALERVLREADAEIIQAGSGNDALIASLHHDFAVAIVDVQMPEMDGYELAELLRSEKKTRHLPIIFLSAVYSDEYHVFRGYEAGGVDFITKPYTPKILLGKVNVYLQLGRQELERRRHLARMESLVGVSASILGETTVEGVIERVVEVARSLTGARFAASGTGYEQGAFRVSAHSGAGQPLGSPPDPGFILERGGDPFGLTGSRQSIRLTEEEMRQHPAWREWSDGRGPFGGLLAAALIDQDGRGCGMVLVSGKAGGEFDEEDEAALLQLAHVASLGLQHLEARNHAERRAAEAEEERKILEALMNYIPEGIAIAEAPDVHIRMESRYAREITGQPETAPPGAPLEQHMAHLGVFRSDGTTPALPAELPLSRAVRKGEVVRDEELVLKLPDGERIPILCSAGPIRDKDGAILGGVVAWRDISTLKAIQEALRSANERLERRVQERTAALERANEALQVEVNERRRAEEGLKLYMAKLEQSNRALQDFASIASHDLQEPLRKVTAFGERLRATYGQTLGPTGCDYLQRMENATRRMKILLEALLDYARISTRTEPFRQVNLADLVRDVLSDLEVRIEQAGGRVEVGKLPELEADPNQMRQIFQNLIGNALKFHGERRPIVKVYAEDGEHPAEGASPRKETYRIIVEDNGIGFDETYLDRIFAPFQRLHGRSTFEGTGMGLAICKKIVERHGGTITAKSRPGEGAVFIVVLPARQA